MIYKNLLPLFVLAVVLSITVPGEAATADDIAICRDALSADGNFRGDQHVLKFKRIKGSTRNRIVYLRLKDKTASESFNVECRLQKNEVADLKITRRI